MAKKEIKREKEEKKPKRYTRQPAAVRQQPRRVRGIWAITIILIICALFGAAVWYFIFSGTEDSFSIVIPRKPTPTPTEDKKGLKTYTNLSAFFSFDYPDAWTLEEKNNAIYLSSDANYPKSYLDGAMPEMKDSDIYLQIHFSNEYLDISREAPPGKPKITNLTIGGVSAKRITYKNETNFQEIIQNFKAGEFYFVIIVDSKTANTDKIESYNKMLESFKFGDEVIKESKNK